MRGRRRYPRAHPGQRPLGIASLEDKIVQRAVVEVMNAIYKEDFVGFSYGLRLGCGQHEALDALAVALRRKKVNWVFDADVRGFFDAIDQEWMLLFSSTASETGGSCASSKSGSAQGSWKMVVDG